MSDAGGELAKRRELFGLDKAVLRCLQLAQSNFGGIARLFKFDISASELRDVGIDSNGASALNATLANSNVPVPILIFNKITWSLMLRFAFRNPLLCTFASEIHEFS